MEVATSNPKITEGMTPNSSLPEVPIQFAQELRSPASECGESAECSPAPKKMVFESLRGVNIHRKPRFYAAGVAFACESVSCFSVSF